MEQMLAAEPLGYHSVWIAEALPALTSFFTPLEEVQRRQRLYREAALAAGHSPAVLEALEGQSWVMRVVHVAPDRDEAVRAGVQTYLDATGHQRVMLVTALPGLATNLALRSMRLFADEVAPALSSVAPSA